MVINIVHTQQRNLQLDRMKPPTGMRLAGRGLDIIGLKPSDGLTGD